MHGFQLAVPRKPPTARLHFKSPPQVLIEKRVELENGRSRLMNGLNKLKETNTVVDAMEIELGKLQPVLAEKSIATEKLVVQVGRHAAKTRGSRCGMRVH